jgi:hypothetical protein
MYVAPPAHVKGTYMSRFVVIAAVLNAAVGGGFRALMGACSAPEAESGFFEARSPIS